MLVGAFDPGAWTGLVFCNGPGSGFAFRFANEYNGRRFDGYDFLDVVREIGPNAPDGSYARMSFYTSPVPAVDPDSPKIEKDTTSEGMTLEWAIADNNTCVGRVQMKTSGTLEFRGYCPWDWSGSWSVSLRQPSAPDASCSLRGISTAADEELVVKLIRSAPGAAAFPPPSFAEEESEVVLRLPMEAGETLHFVAAITEGSDDGHKQDYSTTGAAQIDQLLQDAEERYATTRVTVDRHWDGLAESITHNLHWMTALKPEHGRRYTPAGRRWIFPRFGGGKDHWTVFCWDAFFNTLELSLESPELAYETLASVLETQYENGNIPNWRGRFFGTPDRSQPPIGSFVTLKMFLRTGDRLLLESAFPALVKWSEWWRAPKGSGRRRDGNGNGLFEWGSDLELLRHSPAPWENDASPHQLAAWESGQDDLPNWDNATWVDGAETLDLESVDLNSLLALDYECLGTIARTLGLTEKADRYAALYRALSDRINELLWNEDLGMYVDRFWDGHTSRRLAASNFYPLIAGIPTQARAQRMLETLLNEKKFWGQYVLPSISRDDAAFSDQQYWRGTIWPPTNYLVYQGLKRYRFHKAAAELADRSVDLFLDSWRRFQFCRENYDSRTGEGGGQKYQSWGPLFALMGIEEFLDVTPWDGLRIGTMSPPPSTTLDRIRIRGCLWRVALSPSGLNVSVDGRAFLKSDGPIELRQLELVDGGFCAEVSAAHSIEVAVSLGKDRVCVSLDGATSMCSATAVQVPAGVHSLHVSPARTV